MKLAILGTRGIPARYGGFETFAEEISMRLELSGISVTVFCEAAGEPQPSEYRSVALEYVAATPLGPLTTIVYDLRSLWRARKGYDVVYMLGYGASLFCFIPRLFGSRVWINMDGLEWTRSKWSRTARTWLKMMEVVAMRTPNRIIADARAIERNLSSRHRRMPYCSVIPYGAEIVDTPPQMHILDEWDLRVAEYDLVVCRLEPENHVLEILQGYASSHSTRILIVVGDHSRPSPYVARLLQMAGTRVRFIGTIYDQEKLSALRYYCRSYFHGHSVGGTNPSLLEALACGNTVLAHDNRFNREVAGNVANYFSTAQDVSAFVAHLETAPSPNEAQRSRAKEVIASRYTWEKVTQQYLALLATPE